jgi:PTH1 family peptidyl-tRNA hydrolase
MQVIIGLGNPGKKYIKTRHNIGFEVIDQLKQENNFPDFKFDKKHKSLISKKGDLFLVKPQTFMNRSGQAVKSIVDYYNIKLTDIIVIHDDIDIPFGKVKIDISRSSAGHKGVKSVIDHLSSKDFWRIRFGIGGKNKEKAGDIALKSFNQEERESVEELKTKLVKEIDKKLEEGFEKTSIRR